MVNNWRIYGGWMSEKWLSMKGKAANDVWDEISPKYPTHWALMPVSHCDLFFLTKIKLRTPMSSKKGMETKNEKVKERLRTSMSLNSGNSCCQPEAVSLCQRLYLSAALLPVDSSGPCGGLHRVFFLPPHSCLWQVWSHHNSISFTVAIKTH